MIYECHDGGVYSLGSMCVSITGIPDQHHNLYASTKSAYQMSMWAKITTKRVQTSESTMMIVSNFQSIPNKICMHLYRS